MEIHYFPLPFTSLVTFQYLFLLMKNLTCDKVFINRSRIALEIKDSVIKCTKMLLKHSRLSQNICGFLCKKDEAAFTIHTFNSHIIFQALLHS